MDSYGSLMVGTLVIGVLTGRFIIPFLHKFRFGQSIREEGPEAHKKKTGTPTMGGVIFFLVFFLAIILWGDHSKELWFMYLVSLSFGAIGFWDDYLIIKKRQNEGLSARMKFFLIIMVSFFSVFVFMEVLDYPGTLFFGNTNFILDLGYGYYVFGVLLLAGTTNAVNITDGVDGLSASITAVASIFYIIYAYWYHLNYVLVFSVILFSTMVAFLFFNWNPAKVFMGDTGSLFLGGAIAVLAMVTKTELLLPIIGAVFVIETASVIIQVFSFKMFGKRVIKMSPLHHHFELSGWNEKKIVVIFSSFGLGCLCLSLLLLL